MISTYTNLFNKNITLSGIFFGELMIINNSNNQTFYMGNETKPNSGIQIFIKILGNNILI
jgi:hypothetical protein